MADDDRILTLHPQGKQGVRIARAKYDAMVAALLAVVPREEPGVRYSELEELVEPHLPGDVYTEGVSVVWYMTAVKQDLEVRGVLRQLKGSPQRLVRTDG